MVTDLCFRMMLCESWSLRRQGLFLIYLSGVRKVADRHGEGHPCPPGERVGHAGLFDQSLQLAAVASGVASGATGVHQHLYHRDQERGQEQVNIELVELKMSRKEVPFKQLTRKHGVLALSSPDRRRD